MFRDVEEYCKTCGVCQKATQKGVKKAPLVPLPIVSEPFSRIAMDIVGPLLRSRLGNKYLLVLCDYATRYPEAVPLKSIDAESVAEELIKVFARMGVPREILTDQGSNFTSQLLAELYRLLQVRPIRTSPYHPETKTAVRTFLGLTGYYRRFMPNFASVAAPLTDLTKKSMPNSVVWNDKCEDAFKVLKDTLLHNRKRVFSDQTVVGCIQGIPTGKKFCCADRP